MSGSVPEQGLSLEWVYGYRGIQCRTNLHYNSEGNIVYCAAAACIIYNVEERTQSYYRHHDDDVLSLTMHPEKTLVASGETGKSPAIYVWDSVSLETVTKLLAEDSHTHGISSLAFSPCGSRLLSIGMDPKSLLAVWDWEAGEQLSIVSGHTDRILDCCFLHDSDSTFFTVGAKHVKLWDMEEGYPKSRRGIFGDSGKLQTVLCCTRGNVDDSIVSGTMDGSIYVWNKNEIANTIDEAAPGPIYSIISTGEEYCLGGKFGHVSIWNNDFEKTFELNISEHIPGSSDTCHVRSVQSYDDKLIVGTSHSDIVVFNNPTGDDMNVEVVTRGHAEGELWGLAVHPSQDMAATASDDKTLRLWNLEEKKMIAVKYLEYQARSCGFSPDGTYLAVGMKTGELQIFKVEELEQILEEGQDSVEGILIQDREQARRCAEFSPDGAYLAVGSNDNIVDIYDVENDFEAVGQCDKASSFITHIDWSDDSQYLAAVDGAGERLIYSNSGDHVTSGDVIDEICYHNITGVVGPDVEGVFPKYTQQNDVNHLNVNLEKSLIATGDDFGWVKIFNYPCPDRARLHRKFKGHSSHVTCVLWTHDNATVLSAGGADRSLLQWRLVEDPDELDTDDQIVSGLYADDSD